MRALVTGASGFLGGHLLRELLCRGHQATALVRPTSDTSGLPSGVALAVGDVTDRGSLEQALCGHDVVFHLAAVVGRDAGGWDHHHAVGVQGTSNLLDAAAASGVSRLVHLSSAAVHARHRPSEAVTEDTPYEEHPEAWNHYVRQKVESEKLIWKAHDAGRVRATTIRPPTVLGPGDPNLVGYLGAITSSPLGSLAGDDRHRMPVVVVEDLVGGLVDAATADRTAGKPYYVAARAQVTKRQLLEWFRLAGLLPRRRSAPKQLVAGAVLAGSQSLSLLPEPAIRPLVTRLESHAHRRAQHDCVIDCARAEADFGWQGSADVAGAVARTMDWFQRREHAAGR